MKILQICHRVPYPAIDGGNIVMMNTALALHEAGHEVHQFALNTSRHRVDINTIPAELKKKLHFKASDIDTHIRLNELVRNLFTSESYNIIRFHKASVERDLENILRENNFDIIQLETLFTAPYIDCIRKNSTAKIVLRAHNVEHIIWQRLAMKEKNIVKKLYLKLLASRLKKYETDVLGKIDALLPITSVDEQTFRKLSFIGPMISVPMSIDLNDYQLDTDVPGKMSLFHLGSMDWLPNLEAIEWFLKTCWPNIHKSNPELKLYLAGRNFPEEISNADYPNVICEGMIENANRYMSDKQIMIVPLHSGSGMRVKIIQGMALGKTIISTSIGAEGIPATHGKNILIADTPDEFISTIGECVRDAKKCRNIGAEGRKFVIQSYSNSAIGRQLGIFYNALLHVTDDIKH